jgi:hypothetical protein
MDTTLDRPTTTPTHRKDCGCKCCRPAPRLLVCVCHHDRDRHTPDGVCMTMVSTANGVNEWCDCVAFVDRTTIQ